MAPAAGWDMSEHLFVYGTLLPEHAPAEMAPVLRRLRREAPGQVRGRLYDLGAYPGAILDPSADTVIRGRVFALPDDGTVLAALDAYEGFDPTDPTRSLFSRTRARVGLPDDNRVACWTYVYNRDPYDAPQIAGGVYVRTERHQKS